MRRSDGEPSGAGLRNLRDLGRLPARDGGRVAEGVLYRSDAPMHRDPCPPLRPWPPRTVVDLRSEGEAPPGGHPLASDTTEIVHLPLLPELDPKRLAARPDVSGHELPSIYLRLLEKAGRRLAEFAAVLASRPTPVLVHCAAGKDRTGVATAIALAAVGIEREAIVADYLRTRDSLDGLPERLAAAWSEEHREKAMEYLTVEQPKLMDVPTEAIEAVLDALEAWPGGAAGWLVDHGLEPATVDALRQRLVRPAARR